MGMGSASTMKTVSLANYFTSDPGDVPQPLTQSVQPTVEARHTERTQVAIGPADVMRVCDDFESTRPLLPLPSGFLLRSVPRVRRCDTAEPATDHQGRTCTVTM